MLQPNVFIEQKQKQILMLEKAKVPNGPSSGQSQKRAKSACSNMPESQGTARAKFRAYQQLIAEQQVGFQGHQDPTHQQYMKHSAFEEPSMLTKLQEDVGETRYDLNRKATNQFQEALLLHCSPRNAYEGLKKKRLGLEQCGMFNTNYLQMKDHLNRVKVLKRSSDLVDHQVGDYPPFESPNSKSRKKLFSYLAGSEEEQFDIKGKAMLHQHGSSARQILFTHQCEPNYPFGGNDQHMPQTSRHVNNPIGGIFDKGFLEKNGYLERPQTSSQNQNRIFHQSRKQFFLTMRPKSQIKQSSGSAIAKRDNSESPSRQVKTGVKGKQLHLLTTANSSQSIGQHATPIHSQNDYLGKFKLKSMLRANSRSSRLIMNPDHRTSASTLEKGSTLKTKNQSTGGYSFQPDIKLRTALVATKLSLN